MWVPLPWLSFVQAEKLFGGNQPKPAEMARQPESAAAPAPGAAPAAAGGATKAPSAEQMMRIRAALAGAQTLEEIQQLEAALKSGVMPSSLAAADGDAAMGE